MIVRSGTDRKQEKAILEKHGWPFSSYDKAACMKELEAYADEQREGSLFMSLVRIILIPE